MKLHLLVTVADGPGCDGCQFLNKTVYGHKCDLFQEGCSNHDPETLEKTEGCKNAANQLES